MTKGMVVAPQPEAVEAGLDILRDSGNVVDAAVGGALVQTAVDPQMCGIAGFGSMHLYLADRGVHTCIDFHGRAPLATKPEMWEGIIDRECDDGFGFILKGRLNEIGYQSMTTPLTIKAFDQAMRLYGTRTLAEVLGPAIQYCEEGFAVRPAVSGFWNRGAEAGRISRLRGLTDWTTYRGNCVATNQPPGGGLMIVLMLNILENFDLTAMGHNSADYIATVSEAMKIATVDKDTRMGDPRFFDIPFDELMSKDYAKTMSERIKRGEMTSVPRMQSGGESKETTHICVADTAGNCVSMTHSLGSSSGVVTEGLGFMYNNCMMVFDPRPGHAGSLAPGKARFTALSPTIVFRDDKPFFLVGSPGGTTITMGNLQAILNVVDFNMTAQEAVLAPRFTATSDTIEITNRIFRSTERELQARGYPTFRHAVSYMMPVLQAIRIIDGKLDGGSDPSGDGMAAQV